MIKLPKQWSQVTLEQFIEFSQIDKEQGAYHYNSEALSILSDEPIEVIEDLDLDELAELVNESRWCTSEPSKRYKHELLGLKLKPLSKLTLYEYIDLDYFFSNNYIINLDKVCAILYRQTKLNVYGIIHEFLKFRDNFLKTYENLFTGDLDTPLTDEEKANMEPEEIKEIEKEQSQVKWSWEQTIYGLTNGDITKSDKIGVLPLVYVFNILSMKKELDI